MSIVLDSKAVIIALVLECCFFGIFTTLFLWIICSRSTLHNVKPFAVLTSIVALMYALAFAHLFVDVYRAIEGFVDYPKESEGSMFFGNLNAKSQTVKDVVYLLQTIVGDSLVAWRCCVVWNRRRCVMILPIVMVIATAAIGVVAICIVSKVEPGDPVFTSQLYPWIASYFTVTLATNVICTGLIAFKIRWSQEILMDAHVRSSLNHVVIIVVESAAIYSAALLSVLVVYLAGNNGECAALDLVTPLIGIVLSLLIIQVQPRTYSGDSSSNTSTQNRRCHSFSIRDPACYV